MGAGEMEARAHPPLVCASLNLRCFLISLFCTVYFLVVAFFRPLNFVYLRLLSPLPLVHSDQFFSPGNPSILLSLTEALHSINLTVPPSPPSRVVCPLNPY